MLKLAYRKNQKGDYYPVFGVCMGFHHIAMFFSKTYKILTKVNNLESTQNFIPSDHFN